MNILTLVASFLTGLGIGIIILYTASNSLKKSYE